MDVGSWRHESGEDELDHHDRNTEEFSIGMSCESDDSLPMQLVRKPALLSREERAYLLAVERGDNPTVKRCLDQAKVTTTLSRRPIHFIYNYCL